MKQLLTLITADLKQVSRDKTLIGFLMTPLILTTFIKYFVPVIAEKFPIISDYYQYIMMFGGIQTAIMYGFIVSFLILDEKDENIIEVIRVLPLSPLQFVTYRLLFATIFSAFGAFLFIQFAGLTYPGFLNSILLSFQYGLIAPFIALIIATYANNKVEGMAIFKGVDLLLLLPMLSLLFYDNLKYLFGIIPAYWTYLLYQSSLAETNIWPIFIIGSFVYLTILSKLYFQFKKRVFNR